MYFDPNRATLVASPDELAELAGQRTDTLDPTVAGVVDLLERPARSVMLERFSAGRVEVTFVVWDRSGRAAIVDGAGADQLSVTATELSLLPALLLQAVRLNPRAAPPTRPALETTAAAVEEILATVSGGGPARPEGVSEDLAAVLGALRHAWRVSGSWPGRGTDRSLTVLAAGSEGLWTVEHGAQAPGSTPGPATPVVLAPVAPVALIERLGDVVTGRRPGGPRNESPGPA